MMKYVFVLALLHLSVSARSDTNLNIEIIARLTELSKNISLTSNGIVKAPAGRTPQTPTKCLGMIKKELGNLLDNMTVQNKDEHYIIPELKGNLDALGDHKENDGCRMKIEQYPKKALRHYIIFFKNLNATA